MSFVLFVKADKQTVKVQVDAIKVGATDVSAILNEYLGYGEFSMNVKADAKV